MKKIFYITMLVISLPILSWADDDINQPVEAESSSIIKNAGDENSPIFDDAKLLAGYADQYSSFSKETIWEMIKDETVTGLRSAAAVRVFKEKYSNEVISREKKIVERTLLRRLNRADSPFLKVEIMETLCRVDRYRYFGTMVPAIIQKLDHYNPWVNQTAFEALNSITIKEGGQRSREARIVFTTLRKILFLSRNRLKNVSTPDDRLAQKLSLVRWSIKILGNQELKRLPKEVINLL